MTQLECELYICKEYVHCWYHEWKQQPISEKKKWLLYLELESKRQKLEKMRLKDKEQSNRSKGKGKRHR